MRKLGVRVERADVRWVGARRKKSTQVFGGGGVLGVGSASHFVNIWAFELILLFITTFVLVYSSYFVVSKFDHRFN